MGSVHKSKNSRFWHGSFWHEGRQVYRSTGQTDKAKALQVVLAWEAAAKGGIDSPEQARRVMADLLSRVLGEGRGRVACRAYVERWLASIDGTVKPSTMAFYRGALAAWLKWLGDRAERSLDAVQREDIVAWRTAEAARVTPKTANHRLKALRALFRAALREGFVPADPTDGLRALRAADGEGERARRPFTREEFARVLAMAEGDWRLLTLLGLQTGQRLGDIVRMRWEAVSLTDAVWRIRTRKQGVGVLAPLSAEVVELLRERGPAATGPVFPRQIERLGKKGEVGTLSNDFAGILWRAGLRRYSPHDRVSKGGRKAQLVEAGADRREQQELSFHSLRHTARSWLEEAGVPKAVIDALVGHTGDTGRIYTTVGMEALREAAARLAER